MLDLTKLDLGEMELPPCFAVRCGPAPPVEERHLWYAVPCEYKGKLAPGIAYVVGEMSSVDYDPELERRREGRCPRCSLRLRRRFDRESFEQRFRWLLEQKGGLLHREGGLFIFPCACPAPYPSLRPVGKMLASTPQMGDCFCSDRTYVKLRCTVECLGCKERRVVGYIEEFARRFLPEGHWVWKLPPWGEVE